MTDLEKAIHQVETGSRVGKIIGDQGRALGPLQIHVGAWTDCKKKKESYSMCSQLEYSVTIFRRYCNRYLTKKRLGRAVTEKDKIFLWNGGPNAHKAKGKKLKNLTRYYKKVQEALRVIKKSSVQPVRRKEGPSPKCDHLPSESLESIPEKRGE